MKTEDKILQSISRIGIGLSELEGLVGKMATDLENLEDKVPSKKHIFYLYGLVGILAISIIFLYFNI
jgi:hypothetical protein